MKMPYLNSPSLYNNTFVISKWIRLDQEEPTSYTSENETGTSSNIKVEEHCV